MAATPSKRSATAPLNTELSCFPAVSSRSSAPPSQAVFFQAPKAQRAIRCFRPAPKRMIPSSQPTETRRFLPGHLPATPKSIPTVSSMCRKAAMPAVSSCIPDSPPGTPLIIWWKESLMTPWSTPTVTTMSVSAVQPITLRSTIWRGRPSTAAVSLQEPQSTPADSRACTVPPTAMSAARHTILSSVPAACRRWKAATPNAPRWSAASNRCGIWAQPKRPGFPEAPSLWRDMLSATSSVPAAIRRSFQAPLTTTKLMHCLQVMPFPTPFHRAISGSSTASPHSTPLPAAPRHFRAVPLIRTPSQAPASGSLTVWL